MFVLLVFVGLVSPHLLQARYRNMGYLALVHQQFSTASYWLNKYTPVRSPGTQLGQIEISVLTKDFDGAEQSLLSTFQSVDTLMPTWLLDTASDFLEAGDTESTLKTLDLVALSGGMNARLWYRLGLLYERIGANEPARQAFRAGVLKDSAGLLAKGWYYLARSQYRAGEWSAVVNLLTPILNASPDDALNVEGWREAFLFLAGSQEKLGQITEAEQTSRRLIALDPGVRDWVMHFSALNLGRFELARGAWQEALGQYVIAYDAAIRVSGQDEAAYEERAWQNLAHLAEFVNRLGKTNEAVDVVQVAVTATPKSPGWHVFAGQLYELEQNTGQALRAYLAARELAGNAPSLTKRIDLLTEPRR